MADTKSTYTGFLKGTPWDTPTDSPSSPLIFTPKYASPYNQQPDKNRMAQLHLDQAVLDAAIKYAQSSPDSRMLTDSQSSQTVARLRESTPYLQFVLEGVSESFEDKFQITETFGDSYVAFGIGKRPRIFSFRGVLLNTEEYNWRNQMIYLFEKYLSISRLARLKSAGDNLVTLLYDTMWARGVLLNLQTGITATQEMATPFSFTMLVTRLSSREVAVEKAALNPEQYANIMPSTSTEAVASSPVKTEQPTEVASGKWSGFSLTGKPAT